MQDFRNILLNDCSRHILEYLLVSFGLESERLKGTT